MTTFRLPFRWERLQPQRQRDFDGAELSRLTTTVNRLLDKGAIVLIDPHNYARYGAGLIGSDVSDADFADFWRRLAGLFKGNSRVLFGLMNEPHDMATEQWVRSANAAIDAIRGTGANNLKRRCLVPGVHSLLIARATLAAGFGLVLCFNWIDRYADPATDAERQRARLDVRVSR
jgi:endoglucanase